MTSVNYNPPATMQYDETDLQVTSFAVICDAKRETMRIPIAFGRGRDALRRLNRATEATFNRLQDLNTYCLNTTLAQGTCLLVAVLRELRLLESTWCGPDAALGKEAVKVVVQFTKKAGIKVMSRTRRRRRSSVC